MNSGFRRKRDLLAGGRAGIYGAARKTKAVGGEAQASALR